MEAIDLDAEKSKKESKSKEMNELAKDILSTILDKLVDKGLENNYITPEKAEVVRRKHQLMREQAELEDNLSEVTDNTYVEIGVFLNELTEKQNELLKETYEKCKKWLDDNEKPYKN